MHYVNMSQRQAVEDARTTFSALGDHPELDQELTAVGYDPAAIGEGKELTERVETLMRENMMTRRQSVLATEKCHALKEIVGQNYMSNIMRLRYRFKKESPVWIKTHLKGKRQKRDQHQLTQIQDFYYIVLNDPEINAILTDTGFSNEKLTKEAALVEEYRVARLNRGKLKGNAQQLTMAKDAAYVEFHHWMMGFLITCRMIFVKRPGVLVKLRIPAYKRSKKVTKNTDTTDITDTTGTTGNAESTGNTGETGDSGTETNNSGTIVTEPASLREPVERVALPVVNGVKEAACLPEVEEGVFVEEEKSAVSMPESKEEETQAVREPDKVDMALQQCQEDCPAGLTDVGDSHGSAVADGEVDELLLPFAPVSSECSTNGKKSQNKINKAA